ncbi:transposase, partial [Promicromonospora sp. NPDC023805]
MPDAGGRACRDLGPDKLEWRDVPEDAYGPWESVYYRFRDWQLDGSWDL